MRSKRGKRMNDDPTYVELCSGSGAVLLKLWGLKPVASYMGSKGLLYKKLKHYVWPHHDPPSKVLLVDPGEWGRTFQQLVQAGPAVAAFFREWSPEGDRDLFDRLRKAPPSENPVVRAASHLYLQTRTYRGKPVGAKSTGWTTHGFDPEYRLAKTSGPNSNPRGWCYRRSTVADRIEAFYRKASQMNVEVLNCRAEQVEPRPHCAVYLDPPYQNTEGYPDQFSRAKVFEVAQSWSALGSQVAISEGSPLDAGEGWESHLISRRKNTLGEVCEYVTTSPRPVTQHLPNLPWIRKGNE